MEKRMGEISVVSGGGNSLGEWLAKRPYNPQVTQREREIWEAIKTGSPGTPVSHWLNYFTYVPGDKVLAQGILYYCRFENQGLRPDEWGTVWHRAEEKL
jgi:hypothetical protein